MLAKLSFAETTGEWEKLQKAFESKAKELNLLWNRPSVYSNQKIVIVDDHDSLGYATNYLTNHLFLGVDIEGDMGKGVIELVQIGVMGEEPLERKIFIFDVLLVEGKDKELLSQIRELLKYLMESEDVTKVFQDCRGDSFSLHKSLGICPRNVFDLAAVHLFQSQLKEYDEYFGNEDDSEDENSDVSLGIIRKNEEMRWPGLNDILSEYNASHGINEYKVEMKKKFGVASEKDFFTQRPIHPDFLAYSARDVEDLVEVHFRVMERTEKICGRYSSKINSYLAKYFCRKACWNYVKDGCLMNK